MDHTAELQTIGSDAHPASETSISSPNAALASQEPLSPEIISYIEQSLSHLRVELESQLLEKETQHREAMSNQAAEFERRIKDLEERFEKLSAAQREIGESVSPALALPSPKATAEEQETAQSSIQTTSSPPSPKSKVWTSIAQLANPQFEHSFKSIFGVAVDPLSNRVFVTGVNTYNVLVFSGKTGKFISQFGGYGSGPGQFNRPTGIAIAPGSGLIFVSDSNNHRVQVFDTQCQFIRAFGAEGTGPGQLNLPRGLAVCKPVMTKKSYEFEVHICDTFNHRISVFSEKGKYLRAYGDEGELQIPTGIAIDQEIGEIFVGDQSSQEVLVFSLADGSVRGVLGKDLFGFGREKMVAASPITGHIAVSDGALGREAVRIFHRGGEFASKLEGLDGVIGLAFGHNNELFVVCLPHEQAQWQLVAFCSL